MVNPLYMIYHNKFYVPPLAPPSSFTEKTILIVGASSGIGLSTAIHFVNLGASSVIITARTTTKGLLAKTHIEKVTSTTGKNIVKVMELDLGNFQSIGTFVDELKKEEKKMDAVIFNAGVRTVEYKESIEGFEEDLQIHTLSTGVLGLLILPWLKVVGGGKAHMGFVTSGTLRDIYISKAKNFPQSDIFTYYSKPENCKWGNDGMYGVSKLLEQYIARKLSKLALGPDGKPQVIINTMCPGWVKSDLARDYMTNPFATIGIHAIMAVAMKSTAAGARTLVNSALTPPEENGEHLSTYESRDAFTSLTEHNIYGVEGQKMQEVVWNEFVNIVGARVPEVSDALKALGN